MSEQTQQDKAAQEKTLLKRFNDMLKGYVTVHEQDATVKMVRSMVNKLGKIVDKMDAYLKSKNVNVGDLAKKGGNKLSQAKDKAVELKAQVKDQGLLGFMKNKADSVSTKFKDSLKSDLDSGAPPPEIMGPHLPELVGPVQPKKEPGLLELAKGRALRVYSDKKSQAQVMAPHIKDVVKEQGLLAGIRALINTDVKGGTLVQRPEGEQVTPLQALIAPIVALKEKITELTKVNKETLENTVEEQAKEEKQETKRSMLDRLKSTFSLGQARRDRRNKEIEDEKNASKTKAKDNGKGGGIFSGIIGAIATGVGVALRFLPAMLGKALSWTLKKVVGGLFTRLLPALVPGIAKGAGALLAGAGSGLLLGAKAALMAGASAAAPFVLPALAVGAVIWGGYKLYKLLTQNSTGSGLAGKFTRLRLLMYGYNDTLKAEYNKIFSLEDLLSKYVQNKGGKAVFKSFDKEFKAKVSEIFEVTKDEKDKFAVVNTWFMKRFLPAYTMFMNAFYSSTKVVYIDDIDKLSDQENFDLATKIVVPAGVHEVKSIPYYANTESPVSKDQIDDMLGVIKKQAQAKIDKDKKASPEATNTEDKKLADKAAAEQKLANAQLKKQNEVPPPKVDAAQPAVPATGNTPAGASAAATAGVVTASDGGTSVSVSTDPPKVPPPPLQPSPSQDPKSAPPADVTTEVEAKPSESKSTTGPLDKPVAAASAGNVSKASGPLVNAGKSLEGIRPNGLPKEKIYSLDPNVFALFAGMAKEYKDLTGKDIQVNEAFRTRADQEALYKKYGKGRAAPPGSSLHEHGLAIDIASVDANQLDKMGLMRKYGFTRPIGGETWHIEPAGVALNAKQARDDKSVREARILSSPGRGGGGYGSKPKRPLGGRNVALQKQLFDSSAGSTIDVEKLKKDQASTQTPAGPAVDTGAPSIPKTEPSKPPTAAGASGKPDPAVASEDALNREDAAITAPVTKTGAPSPADIAKTPNTPPTVADLPANQNKAKSLETQQSSPTVPNASAQVTPEKQAQADSKSQIEQIIRKAAQTVGVDPEVLLAFAKVESGLRVAVKNSKSSAKGLFQIVGPTWRALVKQYGPKYGVPPDAEPSNPLYNSLMGAAYAKENLGILGNKPDQAGIRKDVGLYLAHHFGATGASRIITGYTKDKNASMQNLVSVDSYVANKPELTGKTAGRYIEYLNAKLTKAGSTIKGSGDSGGGKDQAPTSGKDTTQPTGQPPANLTPPQAAQPAPAAPNASPLPPHIATQPKGDYAAKIHVQKQADSGAFDSPVPEAINNKQPLNNPSQPIAATPAVVASQPSGAYPQSPLSNPLSTAVNKGIGSVASSLSNGINSVAGGIGAGLSGVRDGILNPINSLTGGIAKTMQSVSQIPGNFMKGLGQISPTAPQPSHPASINGAFNSAPTQTPQPQASPSLSLDKTESLLSNINDTLGQIKSILEAINGKQGGMGGDSAKQQKQPSPEQPPAPAPVQPQQATPQAPAASQEPDPMSFQKDYAPSKYAINVSRKSLLSIY